MVKKIDPRVAWTDTILCFGIEHMSPDKPLNAEQILDYLQQMAPLEATTIPGIAALDRALKRAEAEGLYSFCPDTFRYRVDRSRLARHIAPAIRNKRYLRKQVNKLREDGLLTGGQINWPVVQKRCPALVGYLHTMVTYSLDVEVYNRDSQVWWTMRDVMAIHQIMSARRINLSRMTQQERGDALEALRREHYNRSKEVTSEEAMEDRTSVV